MTHNDILRRLRFALKLKDSHAASLFSADPHNAIKIDSSGFKARIAKPEEEHCIATSDAEMAAFLDGLIADRRGLRPDAEPVPTPERLSKNEILKKLRIAFALREESMLKVLHRGGSKLSRSELGALFRKPGHKHYRECGDQVLRAFLMGLIDRPTDLPDDDEQETVAPSAKRPRQAGKSTPTGKSTKRSPAGKPSPRTTSKTTDKKSAKTPGKTRRKIT